MEVLKTSIILVSNNEEQTPKKGTLEKKVAVPKKGPREEANGGEREISANRVK